MSRPKEIFRKALLVTGGSGYIGSVFVDYYAKRHPNHQVIVIARTKKPSLQFPPNVRFALCDYGDQEKMELTIRRNHVTQVVHMAAELDRSGSEDNVIKSGALFRAMKNTGVNQIVYASSFMVYYSPTMQSGGKLDEASPTKPPSTNSYAESKRAIEERLLEEKTWRSAILRYSIAIGASADHAFGDLRQNQGILSTYLDAAYHSSVVNLPDDGNAARDFVDVQDIASATDKALVWVGRQKNSEAIILNVGTGTQHSINQVIQVVGQVAGTSVQAVRGVDSPGVAVSFLDISLIRKTLSWEPKVTFEESIRNAWRFLVETKPTKPL